MIRLIALFACLAAAHTFQWEFVIEGGKRVCFEDYVTNETTIIYGFTPIQLFNEEDLFDAMMPLRNITAKAMENSNKTPDNGRRLRLLQAERIQTILSGQYSPSRGEDVIGSLKTDEGSPTVGRRRLASGDGLGGSNVIEIPLEERKIYKGAKNTANNPQKTDQPLGQSGSASEVKVTSGKAENAPPKEFRGVGSLEIVSSTGIKLSPAKVAPYSLYKLSVKKPFEIITVCYESYVEEDTLVRLNYRSRHKSFEQIPSKEDSDTVMQSLTKIETTFEEFLQNYEELQRFEERFVSTSNDALNSFMTFGQILLLGYLVVVWLLKMLIEKTFRYKKII